MAAVYAECPSCGTEGKIDDSLVGRKIKCSHCGQSFVFELGGSYDVVPDARPRPVSHPDEPPRSPPPEPDPELERRLERWAEE